MIKAIIAGVALAVLSGAPVYASEPSAPPAPVAPKAAATVACEAYVYKGTTRNLCGAHPTAVDLDCKQVILPVKVVVKGVDPWRLDADGDGVGCDIKPSGSASASASKSASASASASSSSSAKPRASTGSSSSTTAAAAADSGPTLPLTGTSTVLLVSGGAAFVALGLVGFALTRRRNARFEP